jgi:hypothetical protein
MVVYASDATKCVYDTGIGQLIDEYCAIYVQAWSSKSEILMEGVDGEILLTEGW